MLWWEWDEIERQWTLGKPSRVRVGEEDASGWTRLEDEGRVRVFRSDRGQLALMVEAWSPYDAHVIARTDCSDYKEAVE